VSQNLQNLQILREKEEFDHLLARASGRLKEYCLLFHPKMFSRPFGRMHEMLFEAIDDLSIQRLLFLAHRGFGKSTILNMALPCQSILFSRYHVIAPISATSTDATNRGETIKAQFAIDSVSGTPKNEKLHLAVKHIYGLDSVETDRFSQELWRTAMGTFVIPRGRGQQIRGLNLDGYRLELGIFDDIEDAEEVLSLEQRIKVRNWFFDDAAKSVDLPSPGWRLIVVGTILHSASLLEDLRGDKAWVTVELPLCDESYKSYWPAYMSDEKVAEVLEDHKRQGMLENFYREMMNIAHPEKDAPFRRDMFIPYNEAEFCKQPSMWCESVILVDPARTVGMKSAKTAIVGATVDFNENLVYVRDVVAERLYLDEAIHETFDMADRLGTRTVGVETTGAEELIKQPFLNEMHRLGKNYELVWLKARAGEVESDSGLLALRGPIRGKAKRVGSLLPFYRLGQVRHNPACCAELEEQLLMFPRGRHDAWDIMDALSYINQMMHLGDRFFYAQHTSPINKEGTKELTEFQLEDLELERMREEDELDGVGMEVLTVGA